MLTLENGGRAAAVAHEIAAARTSTSMLVRVRLCLLRNVVLIDVLGAAYVVEGYEIAQNYIQELDRC